MKKELTELKSLVLKYKRLNADFKKDRETFNKLIRDNVNEDSFYKYNTGDADEYAIATIFYDVDFYIWLTAEELSETYPKHEEKEFRNTLIDMVAKRYAFIETDEDYNEVVKAVDIYLLLEKLGISSLQNRECELNKIERDINRINNQLEFETIDTISRASRNAISTISNVVKPCNEVVQAQLSSAKTKTRDLVNKGSKRLIKILNNIANKTEKECH